MNDTLNGSSGDDYFNGGRGSDTFIGSTGNDTYIVNDSADVIVEKIQEGLDRVRSLVSYTLSDNVEQLILTGTNHINGLGNDGSNTLIGNSGNNLLQGLAGNDRIMGKGGNDTLIGGTGVDRFIYTNLTDGVDIITDFNTQQDIIVLTNLLDSLNYTGSTPIADGYINLVQVGVDTQVRVDPDGVFGIASSSNLAILENIVANSLDNHNFLF
jgi:Ca2+-binding RTX toxin-like protein